MKRTYLHTQFLDPRPRGHIAWRVGISPRKSRRTEERIWRFSTTCQAEAAPEQSKGVVTTQEEIDAFEIVSRICADSTAPVKAPVQYRDAVNYFGINIGNYKKWFMRLFFDGRRKSVVTRVPLEKAALLAHGFEVEAPPESMGKSRIYITSLKDLERLRPLILLGYEDEMKRSESGAEDDDAPPAVEALRH